MGFGGKKYPSEILYGHLLVEGFDSGGFTSTEDLMSFYYFVITSGIVARFVGPT